MAKPWEKFKKAEDAKPTEGPWGKFAKQSGRISDTVLDQTGDVSPPQSQDWRDTQLPMGTTPRGLIQGGLDALPFAGMLGGGAIGGAGTLGLGAIAGAGLGAGAGEAAKNLGEKYLLGKDKTREEIYGDPARAVLEGGVGEMGGAVIGKGLSKLAPKLTQLAEKSAVNATGATGKQASEFADNAGRELLDRGIVKFGDSQAKITERAGKAVEGANSQIDAALKKLDAKGVKVDANAVYSKVRDKINTLKSDPSKADIAKILESEIDNLINATDAKDSAKFSLSEAEKIKRGYNRKAGNWADPEKSQTGKEMYQTYRKAVEDAATKADPETAQLFQEGKKSYSLLAPVQEAAERRAATTSQSPAGGLLDVSAIGAGALGGGPAGAVAAPIARRLIAPRLSSSVAVGADKAAQAATSAAEKDALLALIIQSYLKRKKGLVPSGMVQDPAEGLISGESP